MSALVEWSSGWRRCSRDQWPWMGTAEPGWLRMGIRRAAGNLRAVGAVPEENVRGNSDQVRSEPRGWRSWGLIAGEAPAVVVAGEQSVVAQGAEGIEQLRLADLECVAEGDGG